MLANCKKQLFFIGLTILPVLISAQSNVLDSLINNYLKNKEPGKEKILIDILNSVDLEDLEQAGAIADTVFYFATKDNFDKIITASYYLKGIVAYTATDYDLAIHYLFKTLGFEESKTNDTLIVKSYMSIGNVYYRMADYEQAIYYLKKAIKYAQKKGMENQLHLSYFNLGNSYTIIGKYDSTLYYYESFLEYCSKKKDTVWMAHNLNNIGAVYFHKGDYAKANEYYKEAHSLYLKINDLYGQATSFVNIGEAYTKLEKYDKVYENITKGMKIAREIGARDVCLSGYSFIRDYYISIGDYKNAFDYQTRYMQLHDSLVNEHKNKKIAEIRTRYETEKKDNEILILNREKEIQQIKLRKNKLARNLLGTILIIIIILFIIIYRFYCSKRKANKILKQQQEELRLINEQLSDSNALKSRLLSIIGHDLKNPIGSIMGFARLLTNKTFSFPEIKREKFLDSILKSSTRTYDLLTSLLDWALSQNKQQGYKPANISILDIVNCTLKLLESNLEAKKLYVHIDLNPECLVNADFNMLDTVIRNIISNAIKFSNNNGLISVTCKEYPLNENHVQVAISDNGIGMEADILENLFKVCKAEPTKGTNGEQGTGLGLSLCKEFVEKNGGEIWAESEEGKGTTMYFTVPGPRVEG